MRNLITWLPRILGILFTSFIAIFALDSFSGNEPFWQQLHGFILHLIPAFSVALCLLIAWRYRLPGGVLFLIAGLVFTVYFQTYNTTTNFLLISLPLFLVGVLFMISQWYWVKS